MSNSTSSTSTVCRVRQMWSHTNPYAPKPTHGLAVPNLMWMSRNFNTSLQMPILAVSYGTRSMSLSCRVEEIWSHKITRTVKTWFTSMTHGSNCDGDVTMLEHVFINLNLCCIQRYKFRVCRGKGSRDTVTQIYLCAPKS